MKEIIRALAARSRFLSKCIAVVVYITGYQDIQQVLDTFVSAEKRMDRRYIQELSLEIFFCELYYRISAEEYFWYQFESKTDEERRTYIGYFEKNKLCAEIGNTKSKHILVDKYECYLFFREFFGRDVIKVSVQEDKAVFEEFLLKHKEAIVKPIDQSGGAGVYRIDTESMDIHESFQKVLTNGPCVVEQCIDQIDEMARFHPQSVNTVRIATFNNAGKIKVLFTLFRTGMGSAVIDNAKAGGILASVNITNGKVQSDAYARNGSIYRTHPDTGCVFHGFQIPHWQDLLDVVFRAARAFPQHNYICWDFALTDSGWVMIEANSTGDFIGHQTTVGGLREVFMKEFYEYKTGNAVHH